MHLRFKVESLLDLKPEERARLRALHRKALRGDIEDWEAADYKHFARISKHVTSAREKATRYFNEAVERIREIQAQLSKGLPEEEKRKLEYEFSVLSLRVQDLEAKGLKPAKPAPKGGKGLVLVRVERPLVDVKSPHAAAVAGSEGMRKLFQLEQLRGLTEGERRRLDELDERVAGGVASAYEQRRYDELVGLNGELSSSRERLHRLSVKWQADLAGLEDRLREEKDHRRAGELADERLVLSLKLRALKAKGVPLKKPF